MEKSDVIVIGAGVVGLAVSTRLAQIGKGVICIERHPTFGMETSSRNSEVIHSGIYYKKGSLKARLCVEGKRLLYEFCDKYDVPYKRIGKLIVAVNSRQEKELEGLIKQGSENGVDDLMLLNRKELRSTQPNIEGVAAIESASTGIVDTHRLMKMLESQAKEKGAIFAYGCEVTGIKKGRDGYKVTIRDADAETLTISAGAVINSAGLYADRIAAMAGIDTYSCGYKIYFCKGEYFRVASGKAGLVDKLIYPTPGKESLGIHTVSDLQGEMKLGASAFYVDSIDYDVDPSHAADFYDSVRGFLPFIESEDLSPDMSGIRPKIQKKGDEEKDFIISEESGKRLPGLIDLIGIESPGLTASLSIAKYVENML